MSAAHLDICKVLLIASLDTICYGILTTSVPSFLTGLGADQTLIGYLTAGCVICQLFSYHIVNNLTNIKGKKFSLFLVLNNSLISYAILLTANSIGLIFCSRLLYTLTNQSQNLCKSLLGYLCPPKQQEDYEVRLTVINLISLTLSPIISGCLYGLEHGFTIICLLSVTLTIVNILLIVTLPKMPLERISQPSLIVKVNRTLTNSIENLYNCDLKRNWDVIAVKYLLFTCTFTYFAKFRYILRKFFRLSSCEIGYLTAYQNFVFYACSFYLSKMKTFTVKNLREGIEVTKISLLVLAASVFIARYILILECYVVVFVPIVMARLFVRSMLRDLFSIRFGKEEMQSSISKTVDVCVGVSIPILYGIGSHIFRSHTIPIFTILPAMAAYYIISTKTMYRQCLNKFD